MKRHILLFTLLIGFKPIVSMEADKDLDSASHCQIASRAGNLISSEQIERAKEEIKDLFIFSKSNSWPLHQLYYQLGTLISGLDFSNPLNVHVREELVDYIKECQRHCWPIEILSVKDPANELIKLVLQLRIREQNIPLIQRKSDDEYQNLLNQITKLIISGVNPNTFIPYKDETILSIPILNYILGFNTITELVPLLLIFKANPNYTDDRTRTPLILAALHNSDLEVIRQLIIFGADIYAKDRTGDCLTQLTNLNKLDEKTLQLFLNYGYNLNNLTFYETSPELLKLLIKHGFDLNKTHRNGLTLLHQAVNFNNAALVKFLLENNARTDISTNTGGSTPYAYAKFYNNPQILEMFEDHLRSRNQAHTDEDSSDELKGKKEESEKEWIISGPDEQYEKEISLVDSDMSQPSSEQLILPNEIEYAQQLLESIENTNNDDHKLEQLYNMSRSELIKQLKRVVSRKAAL